MHLQTSHLTRVVALFLSMNELIQAKPMGYDYPTPAVPFIEGPVSTTSPAPSPDYDDYDPNDVPSDQAAPDTSEKGYEYPVPQNPLVLPTKPPRSTTTTSPPLPECIPVEERDLGMNLDLLEAGVPLCPDYEEYNPEDIPEDQAPPAPDCVPADQADEGYNPQFLDDGVPLCPEELPGYQVEDVPVTFPPPVTTTTAAPAAPAAPLPDCIPVEERDLGMNLDLLEAGVPLCPDYDEYNPNDIPEDQAPPAPACVPVEERDEGYNSQFLADGVPLCPEQSTEGYNYPVPENPLTLPTKVPTTSSSPPTTTSSPSTTTTSPTTTTTSPTTTTSIPLPDCIPTEERDLGMNLDLLEAGVPLCPDYDEYNPNDIPEDQAPVRPDCITSAEKDKGYNPEFLEQGVPLCPEEEPGYEYPVPENPLTLPPPKTTASTSTTSTTTSTTSTTTSTTTTQLALPECVEESERESGLNPSYLEQGVPLCPPECVPASEQELGDNPSFLASGVPLCPEQTTGYEYPPPDNPLTLPTKPTPAITTTTEYFPTLDYDPDDIPSDQAKPLPLCVPVEEETSPESQDFLSAGVPLCPSEETDLPGYEPTEPSYDDYDVNDVPPDQAAPLPDCVKAEDKDKAPNPSYIEQGVELCPEEQGYSYPVPDNPLVLPQKIRKSKFLLEDLGVEMGVSVARGGRVFSFHLPGELSLCTVGHQG